MNATDTEALAVFLRDTAGLSADVLGRGVLARAAKHLLAEADETDVRACVRRLKADARLRQRLIEDIVVPETWFLRDRRPFEVLGRLAAARPKPLRLLSLPCATGEEPYSMAIALFEAGLAPEAFAIEAADISESALAAARAASYGANSFRGEGVAELKAKWFAETGGRWRPLACVRERVTFRRGNLFEEAPPAGVHDFVFCRNLLIYFDAEMQREAVRRLLAFLAPDGVLFVGHAEAAVLLREGLEALPERGAFAFVRRAMQSRAPVEATRKPTMRRPASVATAARRVESAQVAVKAARRAPTLEEIREAADAGRLAEAAERVEAFLAHAEPSAEAFYLAGLVEDGRGDAKAAEAYYRKALYLDPKHWEALTHLALLLEKRGEAEAAKVLWRRVRRAGSAGGDA